SETATIPSPEKPTPIASDAPKTKPDTEPHEPHEPHDPHDAHDPRAVWAFDQSLERARAKLDHLNQELKAEGAPSSAAVTPQKLDEAAQRAKILAATPWRSSNADSIAHDMASIDAQLADADKEIEAGLSGVAARIAASLQQRANDAPFQTDAMKRAWAAAVTGIDPKLGWS